MRTTTHMQQRMSQRGIKRDMVNTVLSYGRPEHDRYVLTRREILELLVSLQREERVLKKMLDKGGVAVVAVGDTLITTYNYSQPKH
ncbi:DUF4258 domain-containing protein [Azotobacter beijerinckii]|uniref:DUF4258 domain-containing protein n=1 Tax=Azotobacter beijerinckii TaxID=170623 RepID=UPI002952CD6B|nr:DUF4258 domain-containing protein [Azotobacter beijerinckii]MDV7211338.1 DUF4258 domain-containing protein [Azotobacter beijerinckii]